MSDSFGYGFWSLTLLNTLLFVGFAFSFQRPRSRRDWRSFGAFSAFLVALFTEMYGFPLTIYLLSGWLQRRFPGLDLFTHESGHLLQTLTGWSGDPHLAPLHILSNILVAAGFILLASAWPVLYRAQRAGTLATTGPYARVRHPQYAGFILIISGLLLQWPTLLTLIMYPVLLTMYLRLARREESEAKDTFGAEYSHYAAQTPAFIPKRRSRRPQGASATLLRPEPKEVTPHE